MQAIIVELCRTTRLETYFSLLSLTFYARMLSEVTTFPRQEALAPSSPPSRIEHCNDQVISAQKSPVCWHMVIIALCLHNRLILKERQGRFQ